MPLRIVRNDITKMKTRAIVNTADENALAGPGTDAAVYKAAGYDKLMALRKEIGFVPQGEAFITPGLDLDAEYIIHAVSPVYIDGKHGEEDRLRSCFRKSLAIVLENHIESVSFPLIASGSNCFPKEEAMRIALDEINDFLLHNKDIEICLVLFDPESAETGRKLFPDLESYIDDNYITPAPVRNNRFRLRGSVDREMAAAACASLDYSEEPCCGAAVNMPALDERMKHMSDTFSEYLLYLIESKGMTNVEVYKSTRPQASAASCRCSRGFRKARTGGRRGPRKVPLSVRGGIRGEQGDWPFCFSFRFFCNPVITRGRALRPWAGAGSRCNLPETG